jgi:hypothetical protein
MTMTKKDDKEVIRIDLTTQQKDQVKKEIGKDAEAIELTAEELESRIAPIIAY